MTSVNSGLSFTFGREPKKTVCKCGNKLVANYELICCKCKVCLSIYSKERRRKIREELQKVSSEKRDLK